MRHNNTTKPIHYRIISYLNKRNELALPAAVTSNKTEQESGREKRKRQKETNGKCEIYLNAHWLYYITYSNLYIFFILCRFLYSIFMNWVSACARFWFVVLHPFFFSLFDGNSKTLLLTNNKEVSKMPNVRDFQHTHTLTRIDCLRTRYEYCFASNHVKENVERMKVDEKKWKTHNEQASEKQIKKIQIYGIGTLYYALYCTIYYIYLLRAYSLYNNEQSLWDQD